MTSDEDLNTNELDVSSKHIDPGTRICSSTVYQIQMCIGHTAFNGVLLCTTASGQCES